MDYRCSYKHNKLYINKRQLLPGEKILGSPLSNSISIIVGKTGSGKSNLFHLIGMSSEERFKYHKESRYFLLYELDHNSNKYAIETNHILPQGIAKGNPIKFPAFITFTYNDNHISCVRIKEKEEDLSTIIVNSFQRDALRNSYFNNIRYDQQYKNEFLIPRYIQPYDKTNVSFACLFVKEYIKDLNEENIKRDAEFEIHALNWHRKLPVTLDSELLNNEYWFYHDFINDDDFNGILDVQLAFNRNVRKIEKEIPSFKERFIHDLLTDYALYLRKWAALIPPISETQLQLRKTIGIIRNSNLPECHLLPDGKNIDLKTRIKWLCQYLDLHTDEINGNHGLLNQIGSDILEIVSAFESFDEEYFFDNSFSCFIEEIDLTDKNFQTLFERMAGYRSDQLGAFTTELLPFSISCLSSGEYQYAKVLGTIFDFSISRRIRSMDFILPENIILLLDEPETFMHPEMCRRFIYWTEKLLLHLPEKTNVQILISTHSPFILSDVLPSQVIRIDFDDKGLCRVLPPLEQSSFGGNIYSILADGFFLDYTIGEISRRKITNIISRLKSIADNLHIDEKDKEKANSIRSILPFIGDSLIQESIERLLQKIEEN